MHRSTRPAASPFRPARPSAWLLAGVVAVPLTLAAYVQTLHAAVDRGHTLRQAQRVADTQPAPGAAFATQPRALPRGAAQLTLASAR